MKTVIALDREDLRRAVAKTIKEKMKTVIVLDKEDLRKIVAKSFSVDPSKIAFSVDGDYSCDWIDNLSCDVEVETDKVTE